MSTIANGQTFTRDGLNILGNGNIVKGDACNVSGNGNIVKGDACNVSGNGNKVYGDCCSVSGTGNIVSGDECKINGDGNSCSGDGCIIRGNNNNCTGDGCTIQGFGNQNSGDGNIISAHNNYGPNQSSVIRNSFMCSLNGSTFLSPDFGQIVNSAIGSANSINMGNVGSISSRGAGSSMTILGGMISQQEIKLAAGKRLVLRNISAARIHQQSDQWSFHTGGHSIELGPLVISYDDRTITVQELFRLLGASDHAQSLAISWTEFLAALSKPPAAPAPPPIEQIIGDDQETEDESKTCCVCMSNQKRCSIQPCGHYCLCIGCANQYIQDKLTSCPVCRKEIDRITRIFE